MHNKKLFQELFLTKMANRSQGPPFLLAGQVLEPPPTLMETTKLKQVLAMF